MHLWHVLLHVLGVEPGTPGRVYNWWSGAGSDLGELAILGALASHYRSHRCQACWRLGRHEVAGTHWRTCHRHLTPETHDALQRRHAAKHPLQHGMLSAQPRGKDGRFARREP